ncbi:hypothetical protein TNCV_2987441 [Trichonephila clavipes]|nr:hypothetical protein TNCV_2987441 [Trichonephila clavipes]
MGTTNDPRTGGRKRHLAGKNHDNSSLLENDEGEWPNDCEIWSSVIGLKKPVRLQIFHFPRRCFRDVVGSYMMVLQHIFRLRCVTISVLHTVGGGLGVVILLLGLHAPQISIRAVSSSMTA